MSQFSQQFNTVPLVNIIERHYIVHHPHSNGWQQVSYDRQTSQLSFPDWWWYMMHGKGPNRIIGQFKNGKPKRILSPIQAIAQWCMRQGLPSTTKSPTLWAIVHKISYVGTLGDIKKYGNWEIAMRDDIVREVNNQAKDIVVNELQQRFGKLLKIK